MALCIDMTISGGPCPYTATIGDYCVLHARGWDHFKANVAMLWAVYGGVNTALGIISVLEVIIGSSRVVNVVRDGETRSLNLDEMKDSAETLIKLLDLFAQMEDPRNEIENIGKTAVRLHEDVLLLVEHFAIKSYHTAQASAEEMAD